MNKTSYIFAAVGSGVVHVVIVGLLFFSFESTPVMPLPLPVAQKAPVEIIEAVAVNEQDLKKEVARLEYIERKKKQQEQARLQKLKQEKIKARKEKQKEEARLAALKKEAETLKRAQAAQKKKAEEQAKARAEKLKEEKAALAKLEAQKQKMLQEKEAAEKAREAAETKRKAAEALAKKVAEDKVAAEAKRQAELEKAQEQKRLEAKNRRELKNKVLQLASLIQGKIHQNWRQPVGTELLGKKCKLLVKTLPTGEVLEVSVIESSGDLAFDRSSELAVRKSSPLPMSKEQAVIEKFREFTFTFNPEAAA